MGEGWARGYLSPQMAINLRVEGRVKDVKDFEVKVIMEGNISV